MNLFKSGNPVLSENKFEQTVPAGTLAIGEMMTVRGTLHKFGMMLIILMSTAFYSWVQVKNGNNNVMPMMWTGMLGGLGVAILLIFMKLWAPFLAPAYALLEGLFIGAISAMFSEAFAETAPGIVMNAVGLTFAICIAMYVLFSTGIIRVTNTFRTIIVVATAGIAVFYLISMVLRMMGYDQLSFIHEGSTLGIVFSLIVVGIAALNLVLDFDMIEKGAQSGAPKYMEWFGAFGLMVTIIWLYLEILRLLAKLSSRK